MSQHGRAPVPKFGSFKPRTRPKDCDVQSQRTEEREPCSSSAKDHKANLRRRSGRREDGSDEHYRQEDKSTINHSSEVAKRQHYRATPDLIQAEIVEPDTFIVDRRGDPKNVEYGSLHRYSVPAYRRAGYGQVVGSADKKIDRDESNDKYVVLRLDQVAGKKRKERLLTKNRQLDDRRALRLIAPTTGNEGFELGDDFIRLRPRLKRKQGSESPHLDAVDVDYRSIEGNARSRDRPEDDDLDYNSDSEGDAERNKIELRVLQENVALSKKAKEDPSNLDAWLALLDHQARVIGSDAHTGSFTKTDRLKVAKLRISIYERALKHTMKDNAGHERLLLGMLEEGSLIWESSKVSAKWNDAMKRCRASTALWMKYLDFIQTSHIEFRYDKCKDAYIQCLRALRDNLRSASEATLMKEKDGLCAAQAYVLLRLTLLMRDAGYEELAYATWQATLEYRFFGPLNGDAKEAKFESFEQFWDSDVPRIGEENAKGWHHFVEHGVTCTRKPASVSTTSADSCKEPWIAFAEHELQVWATACMPAAADDDPQSDDPFRFVMFSDVRDVIECLIEELPRKLLVQGFLRFVGLPPLPYESDQSSARTWGPDLCPRTEPVGSLLQQGVNKTVSRYQCDLDDQVQTTISLFDNTFRSFRERINVLDENDTEAARFIDRVLDRLVSNQPTEDTFAEYYIAFKACLFPQEAMKTAKRFLKPRPSSLRLYNAYALTESCLGRHEKAAEVWATALRMSAEFDEETRDDAILLSHSWMLTELNRGNESKALRCLQSMADCLVSAEGVTEDSTTINAGQRLKISRHLEEGFDRVLLKGKLGYGVLHVECLGWLSYLLEDHTLERPLQILGKFAARMLNEQHSMALELMHQAKAKMVKLHINRRRPYKPVPLRDLLTESLKLFPENSMLLTVLAQVGVKTRLDDRLRDSVYYRSLDPASTGPIRWSFTIAEELRRCNTEVTGSTQNSVRSVFSRTLLSPESRIKHSPNLWMRWFDFERSFVGDEEQTMLATGTQREDGRRRLKQVFSDGLRCLPWYKPWIIMGLKYFGGDGNMTGSELRRVYDVLGEKEMRLRSTFAEYEI